MYSDNCRGFDLSVDNCIHINEEGLDLSHNFVYLRNVCNFWKVHGIMNTSGHMQSN